MDNECRKLREVGHPQVTIARVEVGAVSSDTGCAEN